MSPSPFLRRIARSIAHLALGAVISAGLVFVPISSFAHVGAVVARATFCSPPALEPTQSPDGGISYTLEVGEADAFYRLGWSDGDSDPTGKFTFYYFDRQSGGPAERAAHNVSDPTTWTNLDEESIC